jgi:hypothetical protein
MVQDEDQIARRRAAQSRLVDFVRSSGRTGVLLVARFIGRMIADEAKKFEPGQTSKSESKEYSLYDHLERLRYLELGQSVWEKQGELLAEVLKTAEEGLEEFLKGERYGEMLGKMEYNPIGVAVGGGRLDKVRHAIQVLSVRGMLTIESSLSPPFPLTSANGLELPMESKSRSGPACTSSRLM